MTDQTILTPIEAINEFYRLKDKYESSFYEKYVKPILKSKKSNREKRVDYSKLPKHECINCKRNVGTIFSIKSQSKEQLKKFMAKCGDETDPCPLDIQIDYAIRDSMNTLIYEGLKELDEIKLKIIKEKNNALFFGSNVINQFQQLSEELKNQTESTGYIIETNIIRNDNPEKNNLIKETINDFGIGYILPFKNMINEYNETNNELKLNEAVNFYINEMIPKLKEIQLLKYDVSIVEYESSDNTFKLLQIPNSLESNEFYYKDDDKVIKFVRGLRKEKKKTRKEEIEIIPKNKTRKIRPVAELIIEDEIEPQEQLLVEEKLEGKFEEPIEIQPTFDDVGNISWNNNEYNNLWERIPNQLKSVLLEDQDWLVDYMKTCYKLRKEGKPCSIYLPKQTQLPPQKLENGKYEFNSEIVNKLFNSLSPSYQNTLLTLYSEKEGVKNYNMLKDTLENLLAKKLNIERAYF